METKLVSDVITRTHGNNRVIDFRDGLVPTQPEEYAAMHQGGGRKNGNYFPSVIKVYLCDFSEGTGGKSVTVSANIDPTLCYEWLEVCKRNVGSTTLPLYEQSQGKLQPNHLGKLLNEVSLIHKVSESMVVLMRGMLTHFAGLVRKEIPDSEVERQKSIGAKLKNAVYEASKASSFEDTSVKLSPRVDYSYVQDKVNVYRSGNDGYAPVTRLVVMRNSFRQNGEVSLYPWIVKITNGEAVMKERSNGATTFQADTLRNKKEVYINLSDRDVFRMMIRVTRFIEVWETAYCIPIISAGQQMRADRSQ